MLKYQRPTALKLCGIVVVHMCLQPKSDGLQPRSDAAMSYVIVCPASKDWTHLNPIDQGVDFLSLDFIRSAVCKTPIPLR